MKILFIHKSMNMGGIERALLNLTNAIVDKNDIDVEKWNSAVSARTYLFREFI